MKGASIKYLLGIFCFSIFFTSSHAIQGKWVKIYAKDGIIVHKREIPGSSHVEFRGRGMLYSNLVRCLGLSLFACVLSIGNIQEANHL